MGRKPHRDPQDPLSPQPLTAPLPEVIAEGRIRPVSFEEFVGQRQHIENLRVYVSAARARGGAVDHILFSGPPGLGKTTLRPRRGAQGHARRAADEPQSR
jgi:chromosomal replication initiation ATPase DnaA